MAGRLSPEVMKDAWLEESGRGSPLSSEMAIVLW